MGVVDVVVTVKGRQKSPKTSISVEAPSHVVSEIRTAVSDALKSISTAAGQTSLGLDDEPTNGQVKKGKKHAVDGNGVIRTPSDTAPVAVASA